MSSSRPNYGVITPIPFTLEESPVYDRSMSKIENFHNICLHYSHLPLVQITTAAIGLKESRIVNGRRVLEFPPNAINIFNDLISGAFHGDTTGEIAVMILGLSRTNWDLSLLAIDRCVNPLVRQWCKQQVAREERLARIIK